MQESVKKTGSEKEEMQEESFPKKIMTSIQSSEHSATSVAIASLNKQGTHTATDATSAQSLKTEKGSGLASQRRLLACFMPAKLHEKVKNPLFSLPERPDVCEEMLKDVIYSYLRIDDLDIHAYKNADDYLIDFRELTA